MLVDASGCFRRKHLRTPTTKSEPGRAGCKFRGSCAGERSMCKWELGAVGILITFSAVAASPGCSGDKSGMRDDVGSFGNRDAGEDPFGNSGGSGFNAGNRDGGLSLGDGAVRPPMLPGNCGAYCFESNTG